MMKKFTLVTAIALFFTSTIFAQFTMDGSFRTRAMALHGYKMPVIKDAPATFGADQQSRLILNYKNDKIQTRLTIQDARVWGADDMYNPTGVQQNTYGLGVYEAWAQVKMGENSQLRVGRQEWKYNYSRLISHRGWWTSGQSYDGLLYMFHKKDAGLFVDFGLSYNNDMKPGSGLYVDAYSQRTKTMNFLNVKKAINKKFNVTLNLILSGKQHQGFDAATGKMSHADVLYVKMTEGLIFNYNMGKKGEDGVFGTLSAYYQHGTNANKGGGGSAVSAYMMDAQVGFRTMEKKLELSAGVEILSGHDATNTDEDYMKQVHTFDLLNGGRHPYYGGTMDYFVMPAHMKNGGMMDPYFKVNYKLNKKGMLKLGVFLPMLATNVKTKRKDDAGEAILFDKGLGQNIDLAYIHKFSKEVKIRVGASYFMMSDTFKEMKGMKVSDQINATNNESGQQYFAYIMLTIKPRFFSSEKK